MPSFVLTGLSAESAADKLLTVSPRSPFSERARREYGQGAGRDRWPFRSHPPEIRRKRVYRRPGTVSDRPTPLRLTAVLEMSEARGVNHGLRLVGGLLGLKLPELDAGSHYAPNLRTKPHARRDTIAATMDVLNRPGFPGDRIA